MLMASSPLLAAAPAQGDGAVTTMTGPGASGDAMFITYVGCAALDGAATAPISRLNLGPGAAPMGTRTLGIVPRGQATASGPTVSFDSLAGLGVGLQVRSEVGTTGVSHVWLSTPDAATGHAWRGSAALSVPPGVWQHVDTAALVHQWSLVDLATGQVAASESATPAEFAARHGDGPGMAVTGFGCDGHAFNLDAVTADGHTWDFEGLSLTTSIRASAPAVARGAEVSVEGVVTDASQRVTGDPLVLQTRVPGTEQWRDASPLTYTVEGASRVSVKIDHTQELRWLRPTSEYADAGASEPILVTVTD